jgi:hypothetical protein
MTTALIESRPSLFPERHRGRPAGGRGLTLEERLESAWRAIAADGQAACPVCRGAMRAEDGAARCSACGSTLA